MVGDQQAVGEVKTSISHMIRRVPEKHTTRGSTGKLMRSCGIETGVAHTPKDTKVVIERSGSEDGKMRRVGAERALVDSRLSR